MAQRSDKVGGSTSARWRRDDAAAGAPDLASAIRPTAGTQQALVSGVTRSQPRCRYRVRRRLWPTQSSRRPAGFAASSSSSGRRLPLAAPPGSADVSNGYCRHENGEPRGLRLSQQFAVLQRRPAALIRRHDVVPEQKTAQRRRGPLIEQNEHLRWSKGAARRVFKDLANLLERDPGKRHHEIGDGQAVLEILEQRGQRNSGVAKHPGTTDPLRVAFRGKARRPVDHLQRIAPRCDAGCRFRCRRTSGSRR